MGKKAGGCRSEISGGKEDRCNARNSRGREGQKRPATKSRKKNYPQSKKGKANQLRRKKRKNAIGQRWPVRGNKGSTDRVDDRGNPPRKSQIDRQPKQKRRKRTCQFADY